MKKNLVVLLFAALCFAMSFAVFSYAASAGSESDPIVTKSYVDDLIKSLKEEIDTQESSSGSFEAIKIEQGKSLIGGSGCEIILRSGNAAAVDNATNDGIPDLTSGTNLSGGKNLSKNHLMIIPKDDGRGIICTSESWVMVKGNYEIK